MIQLAYITAAVCFILSLKGLSAPATAKRGNLYGVAGMTLAVAATLAVPGLTAYTRIAIAALAGGGIGALLASRVPMTAMPEMVALLQLEDTKFPSGGNVSVRTNPVAGLGPRFEMVIV